MDTQNKNIQLDEKIPEWKLKLSYFYSENRLAIKRGGMFLLFFTDLIIVFAMGAVLINYETGTPREDKTIKEIVVAESPKKIIDEKFLPKDLVFSETTVTKSDNNYDAITKVTNPNNEWAVKKMTYTYNVSGQEQEPRERMILPRSETYLPYFGIEASPNVSLEIIDTKWERIYDFSRIDYKNNITIEDAIFKSSSNKQISGIVEFTLNNDTPLDIWEIGLPIALLDPNDNIISVYYTTANEVEAQEKRSIEVIWHTPIEGTVSKVEILPEVNLLDDSALIKIKSNPGSPPGRE